MSIWNNENRLVFLDTAPSDASGPEVLTLDAESANYETAEYEVLLAELSILSRRVDSEADGSGRTELCRAYLDFVRDNDEIRNDNLAEFLNAQGLEGNLDSLNRLILELRRTALADVSSEASDSDEDAESSSRMEEISQRLSQINIDTSSLDRIDFDANEFFPEGSGLDGLDLNDPTALFELEPENIQVEMMGVQAAYGKVGEVVGEVMGEDSAIVSAFQSVESFVADTQSMNTVEWLGSLGGNPAFDQLERDLQNLK